MSTAARNAGARRRSLLTLPAAVALQAGDVLVTTSMTTFGPEAAPGNAVVPAAVRGLTFPVVDFVARTSERPATRMAAPATATNRSTPCAHFACQWRSIGVRTASAVCIAGGPGLGAAKNSLFLVGSVVRQRRLPACRLSSGNVVPMEHKPPRRHPGGTQSELRRLPLHDTTVSTTPIADSCRAVPVCDQGCRWSRGVGRRVLVSRRLPRRHRCIPAWRQSTDRGGLYQVI